MENFIQLAAAFGVGGLLVKLIDIFVLQPFIEKKELNNWLRDKKLVAYSAAVEDLANMGFKNEGKCPFEDLGSLSQTLLLVESTELQNSSIVICLIARNYMIAKRAPKRKVNFLIK
ncbi:TPA: hypothetical protein ACQYCL_003320 [Vibrio parahaemolyticus]